MLAAGRTGHVVLLDKILHLLLGIGVDGPAQIDVILLRIVLNDFIRAEPLLTFLTIHQRIGKAAQMAGSHPCLGIH